MGMMNSISVGLTRLAAIVGLGGVASLDCQEIGPPEPMIQDERYNVCTGLVPVVQKQFDLYHPGGSLCFFDPEKCSVDYSAGKYGCQFKCSSPDSPTGTRVVFTDDEGNILVDYVYGDGYISVKLPDGGSVPACGVDDVFTGHATNGD